MEASFAYDVDITWEVEGTLQNSPLAYFNGQLLPISMANYINIHNTVIDDTVQVAN